MEASDLPSQVENSLFVVSVDLLLEVTKIVLEVTDLLFECSYFLFKSPYAFLDSCELSSQTFSFLLGAFLMLVKSAGDHGHFGVDTSRDLLHLLVSLFIGPIFKCSHSLTLLVDLILHETRDHALLLDELLQNDSNLRVHALSKRLLLSLDFGLEALYVGS